MDASNSPERSGISPELAAQLAAKKGRKDIARPRRFQGELPSPIGPHPFDALLSEERCWTFRQVLARRSGRLAVVVEDCYDPHNATAVMRTCEAFGIQNLYVTTGRSSFKVNRRISQGSHRYVDVHVFPEIGSCYAALRERGFTIHATDLHADAVIGPQQLADRLVEQPLALVFGSEGFGISSAARDGVDGFVLIPMAGFTQSLNLSVSVAVSLYAIRGDQLAVDGPGDLSAVEQRTLYERWVASQHPAAAERLLPGIGARLAEPATAWSKRGEELDSFAGPPVSGDGQSEEAGSA